METEPRPSLVPPRTSLGARPSHLFSEPLLPYLRDGGRRHLLRGAAVSTDSSQAPTVPSAPLLQLVPGPARGLLWLKEGPHFMSDYVQVSQIIVSSQLSNFKSCSQKKKKNLKWETIQKASLFGMDFERRCFCCSGTCNLPQRTQSYSPNPCAGKIKQRVLPASARPPLISDASP